MWSLYLAIGAGSIPVLFLINDDDRNLLVLVLSTINPVREGIVLIGLN